MDDQQHAHDPLDELPEQTRIRLEKAARLRELGIDPYTPRTQRTHQIAQLAPLVAVLGAATESAGTGTPVTIVGRLIRRRDMGKSTFAHLQDGSGEFQIYLRRAALARNPTPSSRR